MEEYIALILSVVIIKAMIITFTYLVIVSLFQVFETV